MLTVVWAVVLTMCGLSVDLVLRRLRGYLARTLQQKNTMPNELATERAMAIGWSKPSLVAWVVVWLGSLLVGWLTVVLTECWLFTGSAIRHEAAQQRALYTIRWMEDILHDF